jgi:hypothetical protein
MGELSADIEKMMVNDVDFIIVANVGETMS